MKAYSLSHRILGIVLLAQMLCALSLGTAVVLHEAQTHLRTFDVRLQGHSDSLLGAIQDAEDADATVQVDPKELRIPGDDVFAVYNQGGQMLGSSRAAPRELTVRTANGFRTAVLRGVKYRILQREGLRVIDRAEYGKDGLERPVTIVYASSEARVWRQIFEAVSFSLVTILLSAALTMACVAFFLRRALLPLSDLAAAAANISPPSLTFSPPVSVQLVRELRPLADVLTQAVTKLRDAFDREQRFVGDAAHELKTAISVVRSSIQLQMLRLRTPNEYAAGLERVLEDNGRVESLAAQMLLLSRLEGTFDTPASPFDFREAVTAAVQQLAPIAEERRLQLDCECQPGLAVCITSEQAQTLISNIVLNAIQNSEPGSTVRIRVARRGKTAVAFEVKDWGRGIGPEAIPHIFERFYREDSSRSRNTGGTGLGLAICKSIADRCGATIHVVSEVGEGTKVTVTFSQA